MSDCLTRFVGTIKKLLSNNVFQPISAQKMKQNDIEKQLNLADLILSQLNQLRMAENLILSWLITKLSSAS